MNIPKDNKKLRTLIKRYERALKKEQKDTGFINDGAGKRYLIGPYYLILGAFNDALNAFRWFQQNFDDDSGEPFHRLCWALALFRSGNQNEAANMLKKTMLLNLYLIPYVIGKKQDEYDIWHGSNWDQSDYIDEIPGEFLDLWDEEAKDWATNLYYSPEFGKIRNRYIEIYHQLKTEPVGNTRSRLVEESMALMNTELKGL